MTGKGFVRSEFKTDLCRFHTGDILIHLASNKHLLSFCHLGSTERLQNKALHIIDK